MPTDRPLITPEVDQDPRDVVYGRRHRDGAHVLRTRIPQLAWWYLSNRYLVIATSAVACLFVAGFIVSVIDSEVLPTVSHGNLHEERAQFAAVVERAWASNPTPAERAVIENAVGDALTTDDAEVLDAAIRSVRETYR